MRLLAYTSLSSVRFGKLYSDKHLHIWDLNSWKYLDKRETYDWYTIEWNVY